MGDLASAIVELGVGAEKRRHARKELRQAVGVVVEGILKHTRSGDDWVLLGDENVVNDPPRLYRVERVTWPLRGTDFKSYESSPTSTLVLWDLASDDSIAYNNCSNGAVLHDVRKATDIVTKWDEFDGSPEDWVTADVVGSTINLVADDPTVDVFAPPTLHLATDADLMQFAADAQAIVRNLSERMRSSAKQFSDAARAIAALKPE